MSLQYVIDGCNITHHPEFLKNISKKYSDSRVELIEFIRINKLCGSENNRAWVIFDGYPDSALNNLSSEGLNILFSSDQSADEKIKKILENAGNTRNFVVVSDDKEIISFARLYRAKALSVEKFVTVKTLKPGARDIGESKIGFSAMHKINEELRRLWLK
jgi:predicted RNA-binding protein with PIN domain